MKVSVGFKANDIVTYNGNGESVTATIVTVHNEPNAPAGFEYTIRITGRSRVYRRGMQFRTDGLTLKLKNRPKVRTESEKAHAEKTKRERKDMATLKDMKRRMVK